MYFPYFGVNYFVYVEGHHHTHAPPSQGGLADIELLRGVLQKLRNGVRHREG